MSLPVCVRYQRRSGRNATTSSIGGDPTMGQLVPGSPLPDFSRVTGQRGDVGGLAAWSTTPLDVVGLSSGVAAIATADNFTCALLLTGGVKCWGLNNWYQLGDRTITYRSAPVDVLGLSAGAVAISASSNQSCALLNNADARSSS